MAKTLIDLDRELVEKARTAMGAEPNTTIKQIVHEGLNRIVRDQARQKVIDYFSNLSDEQSAALAAVEDQW